MATATPVGTRCRTGERCPASGQWQFDGYLDGTSSPPPHPHERAIPLSEGERFPPIRSCDKGCYWKLIRHI